MDSAFQVQLCNSFKIGERKAKDEISLRSFSDKQRNAIYNGRVNYL